MTSLEKLELTKKIKVLDKGYIKFIGAMGSDESIIESARMSTGKGFNGWYWEKDTYADCACASCLTQHLWDSLPLVSETGDEDDVTEYDLRLCTNCWKTEVYHFSLRKDKMPDSLTGIMEPKLLGKKGQPRDINLLEFMYMNRHMTPFESGELMIEVYAPIMVFREWHRHRAASYSEFSARYSQMPNEHYVPEIERIQKQSTSNKQGSGEALPPDSAKDFQYLLRAEQDTVYRNYADMVREGVAKEVARLNTPVSRYSKMRAKTDLRNWLGFLSLRMENSAQHEIRQYANALASIIKALWPKTFDLFIEHEFLSVRFSRTEMKFIRSLVGALGLALGGEVTSVAREVAGEIGIKDKKFEALMNKLVLNKEDDYREVLTKLGY